MIYCVVPEPLADELYPKLAGYYEDDPAVTVIVDRRKSERRLPGSTGGGQREVRDRRRMRITGDFPPLAARRIREFTRGSAPSPTRVELPEASPSGRRDYHRAELRITRRISSSDAPLVTNPTAPARIMSY